MLELLERGLDLSAVRAKVLLQNLANVNTPDYSRRDLPFFALMQQLIAAGDAFEYAPLDLTALQRNDRNTVNLEKELAAISENSLLYQTLVQVATSRLAALKYAITEGRR